MAYTTPHHVREYLKAACLGVCHEYVFRCLGKTQAWKRQLIEKTTEVDLQARVGAFFGAAALLSAQGRSIRDLIVEAPTIRAEVKFFRPPAQAWANLQGDWEWLLSVTNNGREFRKRAWVVFWPGKPVAKFTSCLAVTKSQGNNFALADYAPFSPYVEPVMPQNGVNQRLAFKSDNQIPRWTLLRLANGKRVLVEIVGSVNHPVWCAIYSRLTPNEADTLNFNAEINI
jgi:hypothetical protein